MQGLVRSELGDLPAMDGSPAWVAGGDRGSAIYRGRNGRVPAHPIKESSPDRVFAPYNRISKSNIGSARGPLPALLKANIFNQLDHRAACSVYRLGVPNTVNGVGVSQARRAKEITSGQN